MSMTIGSQYLTTRELALELRKSPDAVRMMRHRGEGPRGVRIGRNVLYATSDVIAWLEAKAAGDPVAQRAATVCPPGGARSGSSTRPA